MNRSDRSFDLQKASNHLTGLNCKEQDAMKAFDNYAKTVDRIDEKHKALQHEYCMARHERVGFERLSQDKQISRIKDLILIGKLK